MSKERNCNDAAFMHVSSLSKINNNPSFFNASIYVKLCVICNNRLFSLQQRKKPPLPSEEIQPGDLNVRRQTAAAITTSTDQKATSTPLPQKEIVEGKTGDVAEKDREKTPEIEGKPP
uniref:Uncharacterized protein n=1 Tax=Ditylum brightwellii TaxID=49249 RepID=A0A7S4UGD9_9STRA